MKNRCWKKYACWFVVLALFLVVGALIPQIQNRVWAQEQGKFLADRHQARGANCAACHKESPPKGPVSSEVCTKCHGSAEKVAEKTSNVSPQNPHDSHLGEMACDQCHKGHKKSVNACAQCHPFTFNVP